MGIPHISDELMTFAKLGTAQPVNGVIACLAGTTVDLTTYAAMITTGSQTTTLARKPGGSAAAIVAHAFTTDAAIYGEFDVTIAAVGKALSLRVISFPANFVTSRVNADQPGASSAARTLTLANLLAWSQLATLAQVGTAIEVTTPTIGSLWAVPGVTQALSVQP